MTHGGNGGDFQGPCAKSLMEILGIFKESVLSGSVPGNDLDSETTSYPFFLFCAMTFCSRLNHVATYQTVIIVIHVCLVGNGLFAV